MSLAAIKTAPPPAPPPSCPVESLPNVKVAVLTVTQSDDDVEPLFATLFIGGHDTQETCPVDGWYEPKSHKLHCCDPGTSVAEPGAHAVHSTAAEPEGTYVPGLHGIHDVLRASFWYFPAEQSRQG